MKRKSNQREATPLWRVTRITGARGRELTELRAENAEAAVKRYAREFGVDAEGQKRLAAYRVG